MEESSSILMDFELAMQRFVLFINHLLGGARDTIPILTLGTGYLPRSSQLVLPGLPPVSSERSPVPIISTTGTGAPGSALVSESQEKNTVDSTFKSTDFPPLAATGVAHSRPIAAPFSGSGSTAMDSQEDPLIGSGSTGATIAPQVLPGSILALHPNRFPKGSHAVLVRNIQPVVLPDSSRSRPVTD